jgi:phage gp45-like
MDPEMRREIAREIKKQMQLLFSGEAGVTTMLTEDIANLYPGMPTITARPISHPYGFASRAPSGTLQIVGQQGDHPGNKVVLGHRDADKPAVDVGESVQYSLGGYRVVCKNGEIFVGKGEDLEHMVVGETLKQFLISLVSHIVAHTHLGNLGYPTSPPQNAADFTSDQTNFLDNDKILAKDGGRY